MVRANQKNRWASTAEKPCGYTGADKETTSPDGRNPFNLFSSSFQLGTYVLFHLKWTSFSLMPIQNRLENLNLTVLGGGGNNIGNDDI